MEVSASPVFSVLNNLVREGVPIRHDCGGKALCGTCRVRVAAGAAALSPKNERERVRLEAVGAGPDERLACQAHAFRDVDLEAINLSPK
jgi:ferredoxin